MPAIKKQQVWVHQQTGKVKLTDPIPNWVPGRRAGVLVPNPEVRKMFQRGWRPLKMIGLKARRIGR